MKFFKTADEVTAELKTDKAVFYQNCSYGNSKVAKKHAKTLQSFSFTFVPTTKRTKALESDLKISG
ncbi:MAG: hypothetical protein HUJ51_00130 [Eggerthellaceae bacterium]|nr:hypothetical protein [Eggerthellaceae bacterium]